MWTKLFWQDALERMIRSFAQATLTNLILDQTPIFAFDWVQILGVAATYALASLLSTVAFPPKLTPQGVPGLATGPDGGATPEEGAPRDGAQVSKLNWDGLRSKGDH